MAKDILNLRVVRSQSDSPPPHHVLAGPCRSWASYLPSWNPTRPSPQKAKTDGAARAAFRNPWPSWHKPTQKEVWNALQWGRPDQDVYIKRATSCAEPTTDPDPTRLPTFAKIGDNPSSNSAQASRLLRSEKPDFSFDPAIHRSKTTWLGHACVLLQLAPVTNGAEPLRFLFDPMFSSRCSPSKFAGPMRSYPPPCDVQSLPPIDIVLISHNHYDHLDYDSIMSLWEHNKNCIRFVVPLGNLKWFVGCGIPADRVTELDWWDSAHVDESGSDTADKTAIHCTPAQHSSGRSVSDTDSTLWASWYITSSGSKPYRVFFAGDSGYQFHDSSMWPPSPSNAEGASSHADDTAENTDPEKFPPCPIYTEIVSRLGAPRLLILPVSVGATYSYVRSFTYLPGSGSPFPHHNPGLTAAAHMPPWDAVRVLRAMAGSGTQDGDVERPVAIAIHWGTFVPEPTDVLMTLGQLEWACQQHNVTFARSLAAGKRDAEAEAYFLALNHGQSVEL